MLSKMHQQSAKELKMARRSTKKEYNMQSLNRFYSQGAIDTELASLL
jgi:hypothetical protein